MSLGSLSLRTSNGPADSLPLLVSLICPQAQGDAAVTCASGDEETGLEEQRLSASVRQQSIPGGGAAEGRDRAGE